MVRRIVQSISGLVFNPWLPNFLTGTLYGGKLKNACVPVLNCYSCPAATGACPIGALQEAVGQRNWIVLPVVGLLGLFGAIGGRFACPLGAVYALLNRHSLLQVKVDAAACVKCDLCRKTCPVDLLAYERTNAAECVRCLNCRQTCPKDAVTFGP